MAAFAAFDSKEFRRVGAISEFVAVIGAAVRIKDMSTFNAKFDESFGRLPLSIRHYRAGSCGRVTS